MTSSHIQGMSWFKPETGPRLETQLWRVTGMGRGSDSYDGTAPSQAMCPVETRMIEVIVCNSPQPRGVIFSEGPQIRLFALFIGLHLNDHLSSSNTATVPRWLWQPAS